MKETRRNEHFHEILVDKHVGLRLVSVEWILKQRINVNKRRLDRILVDLGKIKRNHMYVVISYVLNHMYVLPIVDKHFYQISVIL